MMIGPDDMSSPDEARLEGALERVRRVARHLPIGPNHEQPPAGHGPPADDRARVVVRPT